MADSEREELVRLRLQATEQQKQFKEYRLAISDLREALKESNQANAELRKMLSDLQEKLDILIVQMKKRNCKDFGDKTERHNPRQGTSNSSEPPASTQKAPARSKTTKSAAQDKATRTGKNSRWQNLPAVQVSHRGAPAATICPHCTADTKFVRNEITSQLESLRQSVQRLQHQQVVRPCPKCKQYIVTSEKPCAPIPGSYAGPGLLAHIAVDKLADGIPKFRQEKRYARQDVPVRRSTQCDWMLAISLTVRPLYDLLKQKVRLSSIIQTDDSEVKVQD